MGPDKLRDFVRDLQNFLINETPSGIPGIFHEEAISGFAAKGATVYPQQLGVGYTWNPELAKLKTKQTAHTMRAVGSTFALSPMVDVIRSPHWPRIEESYGEGGYLSAAMGVAFVKGLQMNALNKGVAACAKHLLIRIIPKLSLYMKAYKIRLVKIFNCLINGDAIGVQLMKLPLYAKVIPERCDLK